PVHGVVGVLQQVGAGLAPQPVHAAPSPRLPSLLMIRTRESLPSCSAATAAGSVQTRTKPAKLAHPDGPEAIAGSPGCGCASFLRAGGTWSSVMVMNQSAPKPTTGQVIGEISRQASPPIAVSALPLASVGLPSRLLCSQQSALSGSTTTNCGRGVQRAHK